MDTVIGVDVARAGRAVTGRDDGQAAADQALSAALARLAGGDVEALGTVYDLVAAALYGLALWRTGSRDDAAEVVQEVFVRLAATRADLTRVRSPRSHLLRIGHVAAIDVLRRRRHDAPADDALVVAVGGDEDGRVDASRIAGLLRGLPPAQREAVYLRHFAGQSFAEIGHATGVPTFTAASRYRLGIARLRRLLGVER